MTTPKITIRQQCGKWIAYADYGVVLAVERSEALALACATARYDVFTPKGGDRTPR